ncbi:Agglutinin-2 [Dichanthelium oligosanthes]|uniref:Agglutinin-2 n=1 Tax=Dichanthelium oligosanthes TaxID=888268 RepID=A0A1E5WMS3_9POAL|nr:Agglutinin-2 [Dichanthelium oligosanthes]
MALRPLWVLLSPYYCYALLVLLHAPTAASVSFNFDFATSDYASELNYSNDSYWNKPVIELTKDQRYDSINGSVGRVWYAHPVPLWDRATRELASFDTTFTFQIRTGGKNDGRFPGDGMAFFLSYFPSVTPANSEGGNLGLFSKALSANNRSATGDERLVAVEFDTFSNRWEEESSSNHVGIDLNSIVSVASKDTDLPGRTLSSGLLMEGRVTYCNDTMLLSVDLQVGGDTPYHVSTNVDLRNFMPDTVAVGFSAATGECVELHQLQSWSFNSSDLETSTTKSPPPRPEIASAAAAPDPANEANEAHKLHLPPESLALVVVSGLLVLVVLLLIASNLRKISSWCQQKRAGDKQGCGPRRYQYCELAKATNNFDEQGNLGSGGSGVAYHGNGNGRLVAVKKLISIGTTDAEAQRRRREFESEVDIISRLRHKNLVRLFGWCDSSKGLLLVYELILEAASTSTSPTVRDPFVGTTGTKHPSWPAYFKHTVHISILCICAQAN